MKKRKKKKEKKNRRVTNRTMVRDSSKQSVRTKLSESKEGRGHVIAKASKPLIRLPSTITNCHGT